MCSIRQEINRKFELAQLRSGGKILIDPEQDHLLDLSQWCRWYRHEPKKCFLPWYTTFFSGLARRRGNLHSRNLLYVILRKLFKELLRYTTKETRSVIYAQLVSSKCKQWDERKVTRINPRCVSAWNCTFKTTALQCMATLVHILPLSNSHLRNKLF